MSYTRRTARDADLSDDAAALLKLLEKAMTTAINEDDYIEAERIVRRMAGMDPMPGDREMPVAGRPRAMDQRTYAMDSSDAFTRMRDLQSAEQEVAATVGPVLGMDSARAVFSEALNRLNVPHRSVHPSAWPALFRTARQRRREAGNGTTTAPAMTGRAAADFAKRFPDVARVKVI